MLASLDPHSAYLNAKNFRDMQVQTRGEFGGLGIEVTMENQRRQGRVADRRTRRQPRPACMANDLITHLDGDQIQGLTLEQAVDKMRGAVGSEIKLTIAREGKSTRSTSPSCARTSW
jgi:carboxyl-terminal processing protease